MQIPDKMGEKYGFDISAIIFLIVLGIILISLLSILFPALLISMIIGAESQTNPFEVGAWLIPFLVANLAIFIFGILYYKKFLPNKIKNSFNFIVNFEISQKTAMIVFAIIIGGYIIFTANELKQNELDVFKDWQFIQKVLDDFLVGVDGEVSEQLKILYVKNYLLIVSQEVFQNVKVIPFVASILLVSLTYFFTVKLTQKRFAGLISMIILLQSHTFLRYDTSATFSNFWTLFYLLSLYLIYKKWMFSPIAFLASIFSKPLSLAFLPMTLLITARSKIARKSKIGITISYAVIIVGILLVFSIGVESGYSENITSFNHSEFWTGFTTWAFQLRIDGLILVFMLPLSVGLLIKSKKGMREADFILILLGGILLSAPLLAAFTGFNIQPYRWIPLIVFFSIGVGVLLSKPSTDGSKN